MQADQRKIYCQFLENIIEENYSESFELLKNLVESKLIERMEEIDESWIDTAMGSLKGRAAQAKAKLGNIGRGLSGVAKAAGQTISGDLKGAGQTLSDTGDSMKDAEGIRKSTKNEAIFKSMANDFHKMELDGEQKRKIHNYLWRIKQALGIQN